MGKVCMIQWRSCGLYEWGTGFLTHAKARAWDEFWDKDTFDLFWHVVKDSHDSVYLSTIYGGGMIHPMDFTILVNRPRKDLTYEISHLDDALKRLAEKAGFDYELTAVELETEFVSSEQVHKLGEKEDDK